MAGHILHHTDLCDVSITWKSDKEDEVRKHVTYRVELETPMEENHASGDLNVDQLLKLQASLPPSPCIINCKCRQLSTSISAVDVLCSARHMEVFTRHGEYVETCEGIHIEDAINSNENLFLLQHTFDEATPEASFKLVAGKDLTSIWLHSIHITVGQSTRKSLSAMDVALGSAGFNKIDVDRVSSRLSDMGAELPEKAQQMIGMMQSQCKTRNQAPSEPPPSLSAMMNMFSAMRPSTTPTSIPKETPPSPAPISFPSNNGTLDVSQQLVEMEKRIVSHFDRQLAAAEERLAAKVDRLISLLGYKQEIALD